MSYVPSKTDGVFPEPLLSEVSTMNFQFDRLSLYRARFHSTRPMVVVDDVDVFRETTEGQHDIHVRFKSSYRRIRERCQKSTQRGSSYQRVRVD